MATFAEVYEQVKADYYNQNDDHRPIEPEVRYFVDGQWEFTSSLFPDDDAVATISLADFHGYFWEGYHNPAYIPNSYDVEGFLRMVDSSKIAERLQQHTGGSHEPQSY